MLRLIPTEWKKGRMESR